MKQNPPQKIFRNRTEKMGFGEPKSLCKCLKSLKGLVYEITTVKTVEVAF
jgi:hypothetical protein